MNWHSLSLSDRFLRWSMDWTLITRLGEAALLLPCAVLLCLWMWNAGQRDSAARWVRICLASSLLTLLSKLAFLGWGLGVPELAFTGVSGHSMLAALVLPALMHHLARASAPLAPAARPGASMLPLKGMAGAAVGIVLAVLVGMSRLALQAHSVSEVVAGLALGFGASFVFLAGCRDIAQRRASRTHLAAVAVLALGITVSRIEIPTQQWLERIVVYLSAKERPFRWPGSAVPAGPARAPAQAHIARYTGMV
ncbi:phosphatase PAP2 family protein [Cupriavidus sp. AU9028]|uniref:phosphatase PAP2 family protein n=1 Tax=Cupriavidus sp. AU9028 TaxID=2871157 RepID=UPI001C98BDE6|nr:phosphatase PAP2 family protein [Cupriavidus sp. AU9028]MBY4896864.1 phosphatase PAP2 family protein [Cupriavidus sp. AU9028]